MIHWVPQKKINMTDVNVKIQECIDSKHLTNNGKNVIQLQKDIKDLFKINNDKEILLTCNGALGINTLIGGLNIYYNKKLKWAVQSFTFPCSKQGLLIDSIIIDIDENMGPSINELDEKKNEYDGLLVTNCFGASTNIELYEQFCKNNNKLLLFDNAASPLTYYKNKNILNYGIGCMVSLHHTKPIGFGEGGFIVFDKKYLETMEKTICFGFTKLDRYNFNKYANNYKMSEISCIYISSYLINLSVIYNHHIKLMGYFIKCLNDNNLNNKIKIFKNYSSFEESLMSTIPILFDSEITTDFFIKSGIEAKKYYYPLDNNCNNSNELFKNIICLPLNTDLTFETIEYYIKIIRDLFK
jgi:dTDP-4-amino-4,6-dideoxygalactose transaminase